VKGSEKKNKRDWKAKALTRCLGVSWGGTEENLSCFVLFLLLVFSVILDLTWVDVKRGFMLFHAY
jgi:hypothetical protein